MDGNGSTEAGRRGAPIFLGVDGGGSGCRARIETAAGEVLGVGAAGPATLRLGAAAAWASVMAATQAAASAAGLDRSDRARLHAGIGLAGIGRPGALDAIEALRHPFASRAFTSDAAAANLGAHGGRDGAVVIVGTGSIGVGRVAGREFRVGGYGLPASDEGSGSWIGLHAAARALEAMDGRRPGTAFLGEILAAIGSDPQAAVAWMDRASASDYAALAPSVASHAEIGDADARGIMSGAGLAAGGLISAVAALGARRIALLGGMAPAIRRWLPDDAAARLVEPEGDALGGAILLAKMRAGAASLG